MGVERRTSIVINELRSCGITEEQLKNIHAPIGLDIGAVTPEEVALAIMAKIIAERRGGTGTHFKPQKGTKSTKVKRLQGGAQFKNSFVTFVPFMASKINAQ